MEVADAGCIVEKVPARGVDDDVVLGDLYGTNSLRPGRADVALVRATVAVCPHVLALEWIVLLLQAFSLVASVRYRGRRGRGRIGYDVFRGPEYALLLVDHFKQAAKVVVEG